MASSSFNAMGISTSRIFQLHVYFNATGVSMPALHAQPHQDKGQWESEKFNLNLNIYLVLLVIDRPLHD